MSSSEEIEKGKISRIHNTIIELEDNSLFGIGVSVLSFVGTILLIIILSVFGVI